MAMRTIKKNNNKVKSPISNVLLGSICSVEVEVWKGQSSHCISRLSLVKSRFLCSASPHFRSLFFLFVSWLDHIKYVKSRFSWLNIPSFLLGEQSQHFCHQNHRCLFKGDPTRWHRGWWPRSEGGSTMKCSLKRCLITINKGNIILGRFPLKLISSTHIRNL